jgi:predicted peptidase
MSLFPRRARYSVVVEGFDWGPAVSRLVLDLGGDALARNWTPVDFTVWAFQRAIPRVQKAAQKTNLRFPGSPVEGTTPPDSGAWRTVTRVQRCDRDGRERSDGDFLALELETGPATPVSSILRYDILAVRNLPVRLEHTITVSDGTVLGPRARARTIMPVADEFRLDGRFRFRDPRYGVVALRYAHWSPAARPSAGGSRHPLVIWLHGAGESGTDPLVALLGNPLTRLAEARVQTALSGAFVLVPQCDTMWMDDGNRGYSTDGLSKYARALTALIRRFVARNPGVDPSRVYIGGCSNGGYMALRLVLDNPGFFAAAFPSCEAFRDDWIGEAELAALREIPLRFVHAKSDNTVPCAPYTETLYRRLVASGARDAKAFFPETIVDPSGRYKDAEGKPFAYHCHFSWIYALNDACDFGDGESLMDWLPRQRLND